MPRYGHLYPKCRSPVSAGFLQQLPAYGCKNGRADYERPTPPPSASPNRVIVPKPAAKTGTAFLPARISRYWYHLDRLLTASSKATRADLAASCTV